MKQILLFLSILILAINISFAQGRFEARGAEPGELYMYRHWYALYNIHPIYGPYIDTSHVSVLRLTENGKKLTVQYSIDIENCENLSKDTVIPAFILADATPGVIYTEYSNYFCSFLWVSFDYGKNWLFREEYSTGVGYGGTGLSDGVIFKGGENRTVLQSRDYGESYNYLLTLPIPYSIKEIGYQECEFFSLASTPHLTYTNDCANSFTSLPIDVSNLYNGKDIFRGGLPGEVYITSWFPDKKYRASFSADTGHTFRQVYESEGEPFIPPNGYYTSFMSDREPGVFYIIKHHSVENFNPWGYHTIVCIDYYRDYGETLVGTYCHDLHKNYGKTCEAVNDLVSEKCGNNCVLLMWSEPESSLPVLEYQIYRNEEFLTSITSTSFLDENLPIGNYEYYVVAHYEMGCVADSSNHVKVEIEVGIDEYLQPNFTIIPNPATNQITISSATPFHSVEIINFLGQTVVSQSAVGNIATINISNLNNGIYFVRVDFEGGGSVRKLVKQ